MLRAMPDPRNDDWRSALRAFLGERFEHEHVAGETLRAGDLFDQFGAAMPLHHATRAWVGRGKELGTAPHETMRWAAFSAALRRMDVTFDPPPSRTAPLTMATRVTPIEKRRQARVERAADVRAADDGGDSATLPRPTLSSDFWAAVKVQPSRENYAAENLERRGFTVFFPKVEARRTVAPLFASYIFALVIDGHWLALSELTASSPA
jgi:Transcription termination factor nusG